MKKFQILFSLYLMCSTFVHAIGAPPEPEKQWAEVAPKAKKHFERFPELLFYLERDYNSNIVLYKANRQEKKWKSPAVVSEWLMLNERGQIEPLNGNDKKVYDHRVKPTDSTDQFEMVMTRVENRPIQIEYDPSLERPVARIDINGKPARLLRIWVEIKYAFFIPTGVKFFELIGFDDSGKVVREKVTP